MNVIPQHRKVDGGRLGINTFKTQPELAVVEFNLIMQIETVLRVSDNSFSQIVARQLAVGCLIRLTLCVAITLVLALR